MNRSCQHGFTLIELAIVTAIIGLLVATTVSSFGALRINTKIKETGRNLETAQLLLQNFVARNGRLPCPSNPGLLPDHAAYMSEASASGGPGSGCAIGQRIVGTGLYWGGLPTLSLGATPRDMLDGWNTQFFYVVVGSATRTNALTNGTWTIDDGSAEIELWDKADDDASLPARRRIVNRGVAAIISPGPNRHGGYTLGGGIRIPAAPASALAENDNQDGDISFVTSSYSEDPDTPFDDVVRVLTEDDIIMPLASIGEVQTKRALSLERLRRMVNLIYGYAAAETTQQIPDSANPSTGIEGSAGSAFPWSSLGVQQLEVQDAWGGYFLYLPHTAREICFGDGALASSTDVLFSIAAPAPNGQVAMGVTRGEAAGRMLAAGMTLAPCP